ncbi:MAG: SWIM zinc finger family protein [Candidatus Altiarchaeia archaeon]
MRLEEIFEPEIIRRGVEYYREGRVKYAVKDGDVLNAIVEGSYDYSVKIDLAKRDADCNCPYDAPCKHAVAVLTAYENGEYADGAKIREALENTDKKELAGMVYRHALKDPSLIKKLTAKKEKKKPGIGSGTYDDFFKRLKKGHVSYEGLISEAQSAYDADKDTILYFLDKITENEDDILSCMPEDGYSRYGEWTGEYEEYEELEEHLTNALVSLLKQKPTEEEYEKLLKIKEKESYQDLIDYAKAVLEQYKNVPDKYAKKLLENPQYVEYLLKQGKKDVALKACKDKIQKFGILKTIDRKKALDYGLQNLVPEHCETVAEYMIAQKKNGKEVLTVILKSKNPPYDLLCTVEDAVLEKKYQVYDALLEKKRYKTYYLLAKRFNDPEAMLKLTDKPMEEETMTSAGKYLMKKHPKEASGLLEKALYGIVKKGYNGYMNDAKEIMTEIAKQDKAYAERVYEEVKRRHPTKTMLRGRMRGGIEKA